MITPLPVLLQVHAAGRRAAEMRRGAPDAARPRLLGLAGLQAGDPAEPGGDEYSGGSSDLDQYGPVTESAGGAHRKGKTVTCSVLLVRW